MVLASVDEWTITYKNGLSYSWRIKGQELELNTLPYQGSISLILWILSNGLYFWTIIQNYVNSDIFTQFLSYFEVWMSKQATILGKRVLWLLDNCSSHRSKDALLIMKNSNIDYLFILVYSPQLAAVELAFNTLKRRINRSSLGKTIKLRSIEGFDSVYTGIKSFSKNEIASYFTQLYDQISDYLELAFKTLI